MEKMFPEFEENIADDDSKRTIFDVLTAASEQGYKKVNIVVGADRRSEFQNLELISIMEISMNLMKLT